MPRAERDLKRIFFSIDASSSGSAFKWYAGLREAIRSLREFPLRCPMIPENRKFRHLLYGTKPHVYRVIFRVAEKRREVEIVHIRHGARSAFQAN